MKRHSEKGMALVITLMMLAIVTFMAVVFLSLSRRERGNVKIVEDQATARSMADAALERAKSDMTAGMANALENYLALTDPRYGPTNAQKHIAIANRAVQNALLSYDLRTSKNFFNPAGFRKADGSNPWNVGYYDSLGNVYNDRDKQLSTTSDDYYQHIANLQYDPRPPVIVTEGKTNENRFYIDLNRNGMFEPNATLEVTGPNNERYNPNTLNIASSAPYFVGRFSGDPEWIGVLERPDLPHSETNRFIGRYAYIILPTGKSLDINFIHNLAAFDPANPALKYSAGTSPRFSRNQGVGSWELNLAGFLVDLHTNVWKPTSTTFYHMTTNVASGVAFKDAVGLLQYRYNNSNSNLFTPRQIFGTTNRWAVDYVDMDGDGPIVPYSLWYASARPNFDLQSKGINPDNDTDAKFWYGAEHAERTGEFPDVQRYFKLKTPAASSEQLDFYQNFTNAVSSARTNTYDRYAYYRLLSQMGADSKPAINGKIHLNFANEPGIITTNLISWVTNGGLPTLVVRSNTAVLAQQKDGGLAYTNAAGNNLTNFFLMAADAMLKASLVTNVYLDVVSVTPRAYGWRTNYTIGGTYFHDPSLNAVPDDPRRPRYIVNTPVRPDISITNIQIYHYPFKTNEWRPIQNTYTNNEYNAALHRILQLAANIYDSMTNNAGRTGNPIASARDKADSPADPYFPSVFRPIYGMTTTNIVIVGWEPQETANFAIQAVSDITRFRSPAQYFTNANGLNITNVSFYGQPWVVGVKKGWPNFNEFSIETFAQVTRKLEVLKDPGKEKQKVDTNSLQSLADHTREIYLVGFSNTFGVEAWNSYMRTNRRELQLVTEVRAEFGVERVTKRDTNGNVLQSFNVPLVISNQVNPVIQMVKAMTSRDWPGRKGDNELTNSSPNPPNGATITGGTDFRIPIYQTIGILTNTQYSDAPQPHFFRTPPTFQSLTETPDLRVNVTNRLRYLMVDVQENRVIDYVTLDNLVTSFDLTRTIRGEQSAGSVFSGGSIDPGMFWDTNSVSKGPTARELTLGVMNQIDASLGIIQLSAKDWKDYSGFEPIEKEIRDFVDFMNGVPTNTTVQTNLVRQVPFSPTRHFYMNAAYQANDPLVHYTLEDLKNPMMDLRPTPFVIPPKNKELGKRNKTRQAIRVDGKHGVEFQDPRIFESDDWQFPIAKLDDPAVRPNQIAPYGIPKFNYRFPNIGTLGQIHRGTPWQTVYLKAFAATNTVPGLQYGAMPLWSQWAGYYGSHPTNDWKLVGLFTTAITENAARGLLGVNQSHTAAWSAVMSGIPVITNSLSNSKASKGLGPQFGLPNSGADLMIEPGSVQLSNIVRSINAYRTTRPVGVFSYLGEILGSPKLSVGINPQTGTFEGSPYLNLNAAQTLAPAQQQLSWSQFTDEAIEAIPQRILSLLKEDEPRVTIYCFGQTLKPAPRSYVTSADFYNLCVNYQVTGEYVTKAVVRVEGDMDPRDIAIEQDKNITDAQRTAWKQQRVPLKTVVESFEVLPPFE